MNEESLDSLVINNITQNSLVGTCQTTRSNVFLEFEKVRLLTFSKSKELHGRKEPVNFFFYPLIVQMAQRTRKSGPRDKGGTPPLAISVCLF